MTAKNLARQSRNPIGVTRAKVCPEHSRRSAKAAKVEDGTKMDFLQEVTEITEIN